MAGRANPETLDPTVVERLLQRDIEEQRGRPLSSRARQAQRSLESYMRAGVRPRWMERLMEIERGVARVRQELARAHRTIRRQCAGDPDAFAERWRAYARSRRFDDLNEMIRAHNQWYPVERDLPMNPRTGEYITTSFLRPELDAAWVLHHFPPR